MKYKSARDWIRTSTSFRTPPPEDGASTSFATRAGVANIGLHVKKQPIYFLNFTANNNTPINTKTVPMICSRNTRSPKI